MPRFYIETETEPYHEIFDMCRSCAQERVIRDQLLGTTTYWAQINPDYLKQCYRDYNDRYTCPNCHARMTDVDAYPVDAPPRA